MASEPIKRGNNWQVSVCVNGVRKYATRRTKAECRAWALETENMLRSGSIHDLSNRTFADLLRNYGDLVSPKKRSTHRELKRIEAICQLPIGDMLLKELKPVHFSQWRDHRLKTVSAASVLRDWNLINHAINVSINEWGWMQDNPLKKVARPKEPPSRTRRISQDEISQLLVVLGYDDNIKPEDINARAASAFLFAIETAMRAKEITDLKWSNVHLDKRIAHLPITKNGLPRDVPLSHEAIRIMNHVRSDSELVFNLNSSQLDSAFRRARDRTLIEDLHFHDTRAEAITRMAAKFDILTLARISGHRDIKKLQVYYRESIEDIAKRL